MEVVMNRRRAHQPRLHLAALLLLAAAATIGCGEEPSPPAPVAQPVKIFTVGGAGNGRALEFPGEVTPSQNAQPAFEVAGKIVEFRVDEGQAIAAGDVIARLDARDFEAALDKARANLDKTRSDLGRYQTLYDKGVSPLTDLESAKRRYEVTEAEIRTAEKAVEDCVLRAPFTGTVAKKLVQDFQNVRAKEPIVILQDESTLEIRVSVPESDFAAMTPGLSIAERNQRLAVAVSIASIPDRSFPGHIKEFATTADPVTRTFEATFAFAPPGDVTIRPGMTAKVRITPQKAAARAGSVSVPARAVVTDASGESLVWVVDPDTLTVKRTVVTTGDVAGDRIEVRSGLRPGMEIAVSGVARLRDGMQVRRFEP